MSPYWLQVLAYAEDMCPSHERLRGVYSSRSILVFSALTEDRTHQLPKAVSSTPAN